MGWGLRCYTNSICRRSCAEGAQAQSSFTCPNMPQALRARGKDFASLREETTAAIAIDREEAAAASGRASSAEEAVRKLEGEAAGLRAKVGQLEAALRTSQKEAARLKV